jgi:hypothetical protein
MHFEQTWTLPEFRIKIRTNNIGLREECDYHGETVDIGFLGDSFAFGHGVEVQERVSNQVQALFLDKYVLCYSYLNGWTIPHYYLFLKRHPELVPKIAVVLLFLGNDLTCDMEESELVLDNGGELVAINSRGRCVERGMLVSRDFNPTTRFLKRFWFGELLVRSRILTTIGVRPELGPGANVPPPPELDCGILDSRARLALSYLRKIKMMLERRGSRAIVYMIPFSYYIGDYHSLRDPATTADIQEKLYLPSAIAEWCRENEVEYIDPIRRFQQEERKGHRLYFERDAHWNREGHRLSAEIIANYLMKKGQS